MKKNLEEIIKKITDTFDLQKEKTFVSYNNLHLYTPGSDNSAGKCLIYTLGTIAAFFCFETKPENNINLYMNTGLHFITCFSQVNAVDERGHVLHQGTIRYISGFPEERLFNLSSGKAFEGFVIMIDPDKYIRYVKEVFQLDIKSSYDALSKVSDFGSLPEITIIAGQIHLNKTRHIGSESVLFYESKLHEILSVLMRKAADLETGVVPVDGRPVADHGPGSSVSSEDIVKISELTRLLSDAPEKRDSLEALARTACMSPAKLKYTFKQVTGCTVSEYRNSILIEKSRLFLISTDLTIKEIADRTGFKKPGSFTEFFRKHTGFNPAYYRKLYR